MSKLILILVIIILIIAIPVTFYLLKTKTSFFSKASTGPEPKEMQITNLADNSFTISFLTTAEVASFIQYGTSETLESTANDDRDSSGPSPRSTHHITLKNLDPDTIIFYKISSGGKTFQQKTAPKVKDTPPLPQPVFGKIVGKEAIVYLKIAGGEKLSSYTRENGNFLITLNNARTEDLSNYLEPKAGDNLEITIVSENGQVSKTEKYTAENKPLSDIILNSQPQPDNNQTVDLNGDGVVNIFDFIIARQKTPLF